MVNPYIVKNIALKCFSNLEHHLVEDDHPLHKTFPVLDWKKLLDWQIRWFEYIFIMTIQQFTVNYLDNLLLIF